MSEWTNFLLCLFIRVQESRLSVNMHWQVLSTTFCRPTLSTLKTTELTTSETKYWEWSWPQRETLDTPTLPVETSKPDSWFVTYLCQFGVFLNNTVFITVWKLSAIAAGNFNINKVFQTVCDLSISNYNNCAILFKKLYFTFKKFYQTLKTLLSLSSCLPIC